MKVSKEARSLSRSLFRASLTNGRLDLKRVGVVLKTLAIRPPRNAVGVLEAYRRLVRLELARRHAAIESATPLSSDVTETLLQTVRTRFGGDITHEIKTNPALIGGMRVQIGSDVWDGSIKAKLEELMKSKI